MSPIRLFSFASKLAERLASAIIGVKPDARTALRTAGVQPHVLAALMLPAVGADDMTAVPLPRRRGSSTPTRDALTLLYERVLTVEQLRLWFENPRVHCRLTPRLRTKRLKTTDGLSANLMEF